MNHLAGSPVAILVFMVCAVALLSLLKNTLRLGGPPAPVAKRFLTDRELATRLAGLVEIAPRGPMLLEADGMRWRLRREDRAPGRDAGDGRGHD
jgi:hypothetical protein